MPRRDPGHNVKEQLRKEVNFGCPVRYPDGTGCGCPILTYHHFDPPWAGHFVHNPDGMIALCKLHHDQADGGVWSNAQLRAMKLSPYVDDTIKVQWPYQSESLVIKVGRSLVVGSGSPIRLNTYPVLSFRSESVDTLGTRTVVTDSDIRDASGRPWLSIQDNWFDLRLRGTTDLHFPPQARTLTARHGDDTFISLKFNKRPMETVRDWAESFLDKPEMLDGLPNTLETVKAIDTDGMVSIFELQGHFRTRDVEVTIRGDDLILRSFIPGLEEEVTFHSWIVDAERRARFTRSDKREFFSLG